MPIDVSPPMSGNLQGFQIAPVQSTDPLQTLAQMSQLRTQGLQQQQAQLGITQAQLQMKSQQAMLQAFVDGGGDPDKTEQNVMTHPDILPSDKIGFQTHMLDVAQKKLTLTEGQRKIQDDENEHWANLLGSAENQDDVNSVLAQGLAQGYKPPPGMVDAQGNMTQFYDPQHIKAYASGLLSLSKLDAQKLVQAQTGEAATRNAGLQRTQAAAALAPIIGPDGTPDPDAYAALQKQYPLAGLPASPTPGNLQAFRSGAVPTEQQPKYALERLAQAVSRIQGLPASQLDPKTGGPTPAAMDQIQREFSDVKLPQGALGNDDIARFARSSVPVEKQPEYDLNLMKAKWGLLGNTPSDQFLAKYAQTIKNPDGTPKTTLQLTPDEMGQALQKFKTYDTNPEALAALLSAKNTENVMKLLQINQLQGESGPEAVQGWVDTLKQNPDAISELPPKLRGQVQREFTSQTGLPLPVKASAQNVTSETAARNALDGIVFIRTALQNPEVRANIGPILGRLGQVEQAFGSAPNLSPQAATLAQELRTRMRYFVFQEGKAILGGRLPQNLMGELESSSASPKMSPSLLEGALNGAEGNAQEIIQNVDRQRFGGKYRTPEQRGDTTTAGATRGAAGGGGIPPKPASIPPNAITHYYPPDNTFYFSMDGGKTWRKIPAK